MSTPRRGRTVLARSGGPGTSVAAHSVVEHRVVAHAVAEHPVAEHPFAVARATA